MVKGNVNYIKQDQHAQREIRNFTTNCCFTYAFKNIPEQSFSLDVDVVCTVADE